MKMWICRDQNYCLFLHEEKPHLETYYTLNEWVSDSNCYVLDGNLFPEVTFENSPMEVEIIIECEDGYTEAREIECYKNNKIYIIC